MQTETETENKTETWVRKQNEKESFEIWDEVILFSSSEKSNEIVAKSAYMVQIRVWYSVERSNKKE